MGNFTNSEDPDEMQHHAAFYQCLHCLLGLKNDLQTKKYIFYKLLCDTPIYVQWTIPSLLYQTRGKNSFVYKGLSK